MGFMKQISLVLWKNWLIQKRRVCVTLVEILVPVVFACLLLLLRISTDVVEEKNPTYWDQRNTIPDKFEYNSIGYAPDNAITRNIANKAENLIATQTISNTTFRAFNTEKEALTEYKAYPDDMKYIIVFKDMDAITSQLPADTKIVIRPYTEDGTDWHTRLTYQLLPQSDPRSNSSPPYESFSVIYMQRVMAEAVMQYRMEKKGKPITNVNFESYHQRIAYPPYIEDPMVNNIQGVFPLLLMLSFIACVVINAKNLVLEKEKRLKESMKLMGLNASVYWLSWFITFICYLLPAIILYTALLAIPVSAESGAVLANSNMFIFFLYLLCYALALITFCFMISTFAQKANIGAVLAGIMFIVFYIPFMTTSQNYSGMSKVKKMAMSLLFNSAMGLGAHVIGIYEGTGEGAQFNNFHKPGTVDDNLSLLDCMIMMLVDSVIHIIITWYLENVRPGEFGVPKPLSFPFSSSYWCGSKQRADSNTQRASYVSDNQTDKYEKDPSDLDAGMQLINLKKVFGNHKAVDGVSLNMYKGQITVLLGHNGAGKTTTMSMLTGFIPVTSGYAIVNGYDIRNNIEGVRSSLGLCPQHNVLFDTLTVREHLEFFAELKGASPAQIKDELISLVHELGIETKLNSRSATLSGGQKRKLSVAIALIAGSKVVILDEPSTGMDPAARRQTWSVLQKHREGRTILLTTHYMDEADVLGDRIAIMAKGVVKCCGSSMFLKKLYGAGYNLIVIKDQHCDVQTLTDTVQRYVRGSYLVEVVNREVTYILPDKESASFPALFEKLEKEKTSLGLSGFGASATTMEEVFLKVGHGEEEVHSSPKHSEHTDIGSYHSRSKVDSANTVGYSNSAYEKPAQPEQTADFLAFNKGFSKKIGMALALSQIKGLFVKKALLTWRNRSFTLAQLLMPVVFTIFAMTTSIPDNSSFPALTFDLANFHDTRIPYTSGVNPTTIDNDVARYYADQFGTKGKADKFDINKYGGYDNYTLHLAEQMGTSTFNKKVIIGMEGIAPLGGHTFSAIAYYNGQPYHAQPIAVNMLMNGILKYYTTDDVSLQTSIHPLPMEEETEKKSLFVQGFVGGLIDGIFISFGLAFLASLFIFYVVKEKNVGAKHMQIVSGVSPMTYWLPAFLWDFINYMVPCIVMIIIFAAFSKDAYISDGRWFLVLFLLILYGWAFLPFTYCFSFAFKEPATGVVVAILWNLATGLVTIVTVTVLQLFGGTIKQVGDIIEWVFFIIFPNYNVGISFIKIYNNYKNKEICSINSVCCNQACGSIKLEYQDSFWALERPGVGIPLLCLLLQGVLFFTILFLIEYNFFTRLWYLITNAPCNGSSKLNSFESNVSATEDSDVAAERQRINSSPASVLSTTDPLLLVNLFKRFGNFVAVDHICLGVPEKECFGLLGVNGAGKTTTFKMLTGDVMVTGGNAYLKGFDVRNNIKDVQENMGYCPQFDALLEQMTGRETLTMYARLRGVPEPRIEHVVNELMKCLMLVPHADKLSGDYSGGNKRKLSTAIALVGDPPFIMLDEPSAGMDPQARRQMWDVLSQIRASGRTLVLTSHSMEECDALCTRLAIMVSGSFVCLGSPQHLKNKFGQGYTLIVQMAVLPDGSYANSQQLIAYINHNLPKTIVFDNHEGYFHFQVPDPNVSLARVFSLMESAKVNLHVADYSVHQTTLEQVFLTFTRTQTPPKVTNTSNLCNSVMSCCFYGLVK